MSYVEEGWWSPDVNAGRVHDHPASPGRGWSAASHRQCEPVYTRRAEPELDIDELARTVDRWVEAFTCRTPAYGAPGHAHCAACCAGTMIAATSAAEHELAVALGAVRRALRDVPRGTSTTRGDTMNGAERIAAERQRQIETWPTNRDDRHVHGELIAAAVAYAMHADPDGAGENAADYWPWEDWWKPSDDPIRDLERAGALIAAEIDRHLRAGTLDTPS